MTIGPLVNPGNGLPRMSADGRLDDAAHDVNNMYVSCERVFRPRFVGRPVVVLSDNDGCAIARSNEAKYLGVHAAASPGFVRVYKLIVRSYK